MNDEFILPLVLFVLLLVQIRKKHLYITNYINNFENFSQGHNLREGFMFGSL